MFACRVPGAAALAVTLLLTAPALAEGLSDAEILGIYSQVNSFDIETALLGEIKGQSEAVRALGHMVSSDHSGVRAGAHALAAEIGVTPVLPPARIAAARDHDAVVLGLRDLEGDAFDAAYLQHEYAFHTAAIGAVEEVLLPAAESPELKAHFEAVLPAFRHHLEMTVEAAEALDLPLEN